MWHIPTMVEAMRCVRDAPGDRPGLHVAVLRTFTMEPITVFMRYEACRAGLDARLSFGGFDTMLQDLHGDFGRAILPGSDCVIVAGHLASLAPEVLYEFPGLSEAALERETARIVAYYESVQEGVRRITSAPMLVQLFEWPVFPALGIGDSLAGHGQRAFVTGLNARLRSLALAQTNTYCVDPNDVVLRAGAATVLSPRQWYATRTPYTPEGFALLAREYFKYVRAIRGLVRKCLVLDCDNLLWGGLAGEDGPDGIRLGPDPSGEPYLDLQRAVLDLAARGVIIALCSKNNPKDVLEILEKHPYMLLRDKHVAASRINWQDKPSNLRELAEELNIGLDSIVFMDDSPFEIEAVRQLVPEVETLQVSAAHPEGHALTLRACGLFDTLSVSQEDRQRGQMYKAQARRNAIRKQVPSLDAYLASLDMRAVVGRAGKAEFPRVAQLAQRTNQFNLTTRRHTEDDVAAFVDRGDDVVYLDLADRLGPLGLVGVCIVTYEGTCATIDTFLLSCRAIGRKAETLLLDVVLDLCRKRGMETVRGAYKPTAKNVCTATFYPTHGFHSEPCGDGEDGVRLFHRDLTVPASPAVTPIALTVKF